MIQLRIYIYIYIYVPVCSAGDMGLIPGCGKTPWRTEWLPIPVFLPGDLMNLMDRGARWTTVHGSLKALDMNEEGTHTPTHIFFFI